MVEKLIEIAKDIKAESLVESLKNIKHKMTQSEVDVILPLVGEFSAGKTSLINSITDSKALETSTLPTTATIFEICFGANKNCATVFNPDGSTVEVDDIADLKNNKLVDAKLVCVRDKSTLVPSSIHLVDTPGLSSADVRHKQALVDFLPSADAILLVVDVNQQLTRSLLDFLESMKLAQRPVFMVLTKCDSKSETDILNTKKYIAENCKLSIDEVACVSATKGNVSELISIFESILKNKKKILDAVNGQRLKMIAKDLDERIASMLSSVKSNKELEEALLNVKEELNKINRNIKNLIESMQADVDDAVRDSVRRFEDTVFPQLDAIVAQKGVNFDAEVYNAVNNTATIIKNNLQSSIGGILSSQCSKRIGTDGEINLQSLKSIDMSSLQVDVLNGFSGLNQLGHEKDGVVGKVVLGVAAVALVAATAGAAAPAVAGEAATVSAGEALSVGADVLIASKIAKMQKGYATAQSLNTQVGQQLGQDKGIIESAVGFFTEKISAKPARQKAVRSYISSQLIPEFTNQLNLRAGEILSNIESTVTSEAKQVVNEKTVMLQDLKQQSEAEKTALESRKRVLQSYRDTLKNI